jgi:hypothetical protein|tara:strand:+ start:46 stop:468 length:423 start_codon:yes stop_codon:yes gene_type:complete
MPELLHTADIKNEPEDAIERLEQPIDLNSYNPKLNPIDIDQLSFAEMVSRRLSISEFESKARLLEKERRAIDVYIYRVLKEWGDEWEGLTNGREVVLLGKRKGRGRWDEEYLRRALSEDELDEAYTAGEYGPSLRSGRED